jgi:L-threonylcarbamoyladenylate synthase
MISTNIKEAVQHLNQDKIIGLPTETVYGLAGNAFSEEAIQSIFTTKKRPSFNPLIVHIKSLDDLPLVAKDIPDLAWELAKAFWPGSLTLILPKQPHISDTITAGKNYGSRSSSKTSNGFRITSKSRFSIGSAKCQSVWKY